MKIVSGYLILLAVTIGALTLSMIWQFNSFQQNLTHLSFSIPTPTDMPSLDMNGLKQLADQAASQANPAIKEFNAPDKDFKFSYSPLWQETASEPLPAGQGTMLFSASRINIAQLSIAYLAVRKMPLVKLDEIIGALKNEAGSQTKLKITDNGPQDINGGKIEILDAVYDLGLPSQSAQSILNARMAIIVRPDKSYVVSVYGSQNIWESIKTEATALFASMQIAAPANQP